MSKKASSITSRNSDSNALNGLKKRQSHLICNWLPLSSFHHQFLERGCCESGYQCLLAKGHRSKSVSPDREAVRDNSPGLQAWESTPAEMRPDRAPHLRSPIGLFQEAMIETHSVALTGQFSFLL